MPSQDERFLRIYCPTHKTRFEIVVANRIACESGGESLAENFPYESFWEYCCDCQTYWSVDHLRSSKGREECPVCNRAIKRRYLCDRCKVLSLESEQSNNRKPFLLTTTGAPQPACPGCMKPAQTPLHQHRCADAGVDFITPHHTCPLCDELIDRDALQATVSSALVCPNCRTIARPSDRFCKQCGRSMTEEKVLQTEAVLRTAPSTSSLSRKHEQRPLSHSSPPMGASTLPASVSSGVNRNNGGRASAYDAAASRTPPLPVTEASAQPKGKYVPYVLGGSLIIALVMVYFVVTLWPQNTSPAVKPETKAEPPLNMAYVPGGGFIMGTDDGDEYERPSHRVTVRPFYIDVFEVTCEEYEKFIKATGHLPPFKWKNGRYPDGAAHHPVTGVNWDDAAAYALWAGKRLPTEEEWEFAARSADGRRYPWGNEWKPMAANADSDSRAHLVEVGTYPSGKSPFGAFDMVGNAWEWTASDLTAYPGGQIRERPNGELKIIRGGSYQSKRKSATTTYRWGYPAHGADDYSNTGFRCVKDAPATLASR
jgi:formylglycine-generating enzyme required for sulfatase activity